MSYPSREVNGLLSGYLTCLDFVSDSDSVRRSSLSEKFDVENDAVADDDDGDEAKFISWKHVNEFGSEWREKAHDAIHGIQQVKHSESYLRKITDSSNAKWFRFYRSNGENFYKDRHYLLKEFSSLKQQLESSDDQVLLLEIGCGCGNALFPIINMYPNCFAYGVDFAASAIELMKERKEYDETRCKGFVNDTSRETLPVEIPLVDFASMIFMLSAVHPSRMEYVVRNVVDRLRPGGTLLFRDYAVYDLAQIRFAKSGDKKLGYNMYLRSDGTSSYFFTKEGIVWLFHRIVGLEIIEMKDVRRLVVNRKLSTKMNRVWIQAVFRKKEA